MLQGAAPPFDVFVVEDVYLTVCNLRGSLLWLGSDDALAEPRLRQSVVARMDRQLAALEDRARAWRSRLQAGAPAPAGDPVPDNLFAAGDASTAGAAADPEGDAGVAELLASLSRIGDGSSDGDGAGAVFRSRRPPRKRGRSDDAT
jgi:hypothetical protein